MNRKHLRWKAMQTYLPILAGRLARGQTNFFQMLWKFNKVYDKDLLLADHAMAVDYSIPRQPPSRDKIDPKSLYVHAAPGRRSRQIDNDTERFVDASRMGAGD
jgi:magnesium-protoporphyrin IX monomethyl ester (oxidative) cyclase